MASSAINFPFHSVSVRIEVRPCCGLGVVLTGTQAFRDCERECNILFLSWRKGTRWPRLDVVPTHRPIGKSRRFVGKTQSHPVAPGDGIVILYAYCRLGLRLPGDQAGWNREVEYLRIGYGRDDVHRPRCRRNTVKTR